MRRIFYDDKFFTVQFESRSCLKFEATGRRLGLKQCKIPSAIAAEAKILADREIAHAKAINQQVPDEFLRTDGGSPRIEWQCHEVVECRKHLLDEPFLVVK